MADKVWGTVLAVTLLLLTATDGQSWFERKKIEIFPELQPVRTGFHDVAPNREYFLNYSHAMPGDYHYRSWWVTPRPYGGMSGPWRHLLSFADSGNENEEARRLSKAAAQGKAMRARVQELVSQLLVNAEEDFADGPGVTVNSFVNLNSLYVVSSLGRFLGEQIISELQINGVRVIDVRKTPSILIREKHGEYGLSRDMDELEYAHGAQFMVVGTYTYSQSQIFVNARLLRNRDAMVLSSASLTFGIDGLVRQLLRDEGFFVPVAEKPVKVKSFVQ